MINKKFYFFIFTLFILIITSGLVTAASNDNSSVYENSQGSVEDNQQSIEDNNIKGLETQSMDDTTSGAGESNIVKKDDSSDNTNTKTVAKDTTEFSLEVSVVNETVDLVYDTGNETAIIKNITTVNGVPDVKKLGSDYAFADEEGVYTILGSEIRRVMTLDSYCQQIYGFTPKYTFFRAEGSNTKYVISREKWNVIARSLNSYHVNQGYNAVLTPYSITVNLKSKNRYYNVYYDAQEWINGQQYTCGPTAMSMISQALNCYASERKLAGVYETTSSDGTDEYKIIKYSPSVHMKLTDITDNKNSVKSALLAGKMVFWHIRGHYMCVIAYNSANDKFLCLNPSGPSHNINAVQWATWTQMMNADRPLKENGFMSVTPYWNLTSADKRHAKYYYYNMGGKYTTPSNSENCAGNDNKVTVTKDEPSSVTKTINQTKLVIKSVIDGMNYTNTKMQVSLDDNPIKTLTITGNTASMNYTLPAYAQSSVKVTARYVDTSGVDITNLTLTFKKNSIGKTYTNSTQIKNKCTIIVDDVTAKKADNITFTAHVYDSFLNPVNNGRAVFKLNGNTLKKNGEALRVNVVNGTARLSFTIPSYSAKNYRLTAVYGNGSIRLESNATLKIEKIDSQITDVKISTNNNTLRVVARVVDIYGDKVERETKITIKINGKTQINKVKVEDGLIDMSIKLSKYKTGTHNLSILAGENGLYKASSYNTSFTKNAAKVNQVSTNITDLIITKSDNKTIITANLVDMGGNLVKDDVKLSVKVNGKTLINKATVSSGKIYESLDLSSFADGLHTLSLVTGSTSIYTSTMLNTTLSLP